MESTRMKTVLVVAVVLGFLGIFALKAEAQMSGCSNSIMGLSPCLSFITSNFTNPSPSQSCCSALASVVKTSASCLCTLFTGTSGNNPLGFPINQTRALTLPRACKITTPSPTQCNGAASPDSPASAPSAAPGAASNTGGSASATPNSALSPGPASSEGGAASAAPNSAPSGGSPSSSQKFPIEDPPVDSSPPVDSPTSSTSSAGLRFVAMSFGSAALVCFASFAFTLSGFSV